LIYNTASIKVQKFKKKAQKTNKDYFKYAQSLGKLKAKCEHDIAIDIFLEIGKISSNIIMLLY